ncbi:hypothetical protein V5O48_005086 [Marasmius crinis-equi]|uniref:Uncharacterized protein n=1 Tax=Marasmius crinis-equi TaxID=585013 RepID=A0ABR3FNC5_9AGAR
MSSIATGKKRQSEHSSDPTNSKRARMEPLSLSQISTYQIKPENDHNDFKDSLKLEHVGFSLDSESIEHCSQDEPQESQGYVEELEESQTQSDSQYEGPEIALCFGTGAGVIARDSDCKNTPGRTVVVSRDTITYADVRKASIDGYWQGRKTMQDFLDEKNKECDSVRGRLREAWKERDAAEDEVARLTAEVRRWEKVARSVGKHLYKAALDVNEIPVE